MKIEFTSEDILRIEKIYNIKWNDLSDTKKVIMGLISRNVWSPEAIANTTVYGEDRTKWPKTLDK